MSEQDHAESLIEFSEDISNAEAPEPLPPGDYPTEIRAASVAVSVNSGNRYAAVTFYISPDDYPVDFDAAEAPDGKTIIFRRVSLEDTKSSRYRLRRFLEAIGAPIGRAVDLNEWIGRQARITIRHDTYEGVAREDIAKVSAAD